MAKIHVTLLAIIVVLVEVRGHGMLLDPPNRSSMWRFGFDVPPNYTDNELFCGGVHQDATISNCGICGDAIASPRPRNNEHGGMYGTGTIAKTYTQGSVIPILVELTANHYGQFKFSICNMDQSPEDEACFVTVPMENGQEYYDVPHTGSGNYTYNLRLPGGLTCSHCVLRWTYRGANTWDDCGNGTGAVGCGLQETFRGCADVTIQNNLRVVPEPHVTLTNLDLNVDHKISYLGDVLKQITDNIKAKEDQVILEQLENRIDEILRED